MAAVTLTAVALAALAGACEGKPQPAADAGRKLDPATVEKYGAPLGPGPIVDVEKVLADPAAYEGRTFKIRGMICGVCKRSGGRINIGPSCESKTLVTVKFGDHAFSVPRECIGQIAVAEGTFSVHHPSAEEKAHLAHEMGRDYEKVTAAGTAASSPASGPASAPAEEVILRMMATGVELSEAKR